LLQLGNYSSQSKGDVAMLKPIQLPSGKTIDLARCIAIIPTPNTMDSEVILAGTDRPIQLDEIDVQTLQQEFQRNKISEKYLLKLDRTPEEQMQRLQKLAKFNDRWQELAMQDNAEQEFEAFKQIMDAERPSGQKLYSLE
jgi:thymidylate kinase